MPSRNIYKEFVPESYYHVYNRGMNKQLIFRDENDYKYFLSLFKRYLLLGYQDKQGRLYPNYCDEIQLNAFCLMPNHFHLLLFQISKRSITEFMRSITTSYVMYFNKKYQRTGSLFEQRYKAIRLSDQSHFLHISRYIHMNPKDYLSWNWSSLDYYTGYKAATWLDPKPILKSLPGLNYLDFLKEYEANRSELAELKQLLVV